MVVRRHPHDVARGRDQVADDVRLLARRHVVGHRDPVLREPRGREGGGRLGGIHDVCLERCYRYVHIYGVCGI